MIPEPPDHDAVLLAARAGHVTPEQLQQLVDLYDALSDELRAYRTSAHLAVNASDPTRRNRGAEQLRQLLAGALAAARVGGHL